ncbi:MAG: hypothetical protein EU529_15125 [Promethearchaeota archaeon]|nr:MAG: hypothetical protein EU529_15125 [Candidatus Lokiarchaeota archaeon]
MEDFIDIDHSVSNDFDELMDMELADSSLLIKRLRELIKADPEYFDSYIYLHNLYLEMEDYTECKKILLEGYERALKRILNINNQWPSRLRWSYIENRHIIRLFETVGLWFWRNKEYNKALDLFRKLLKSNPIDNIGARYYILALRIKVEYDNFDEILDKGGYYDEEINKWFNQDYNRFPDEFNWWIKELEAEQEQLNNENFKFRSSKFFFRLLN